MKKILLLVFLFLFSFSAVNAEKRVTDLTAQSGSIADSDLIVGVDVSDTTDHATGSSKKITWTQVLSYLVSALIDDTPDNGNTTQAASSNWAYDHSAASDPHGGYVLESTIGTGANQIVQLTASSQLPVVSGALLTDLPASVPAGTDGQILGYVGTTPTAIDGVNVSVDGTTIEQTGTTPNFILNVKSGVFAAFGSTGAPEEVATIPDPLVNGTLYAAIDTGDFTFKSATGTYTITGTYVADSTTDTETLLPTADHVHTWDSTGANGWSQVVDTSDTTYVSTSANFEVESPTLANPTTCSGKDIASVAVTVRAWSTTTGGTIRISLLEKAAAGTSVFVNTSGAAADITLNTVPTNYTVVYPTTPSGWTDNPSATWTCAIVNAFEAGAKSYSVAGKDARVSEISVLVTYE